MSNSKDKGGLGNMDPDKPYKVGNKKPPLHTRFPKGTSGNLSGRPKGSSKDLANFGDILMKEVYKTVPANLAGKVVNKTQAELLAIQLMKAAINGKAADRRLFLQFMEQHELREKRKEEEAAKKKAEGSEDVDWDAERAAIHQRLLAVTGEFLQTTTLTTEDKS